ncbi:MAG: copper amine oxidase N-terminal domain-containing protein [Anaerotignum sp.]|nr:copper amine oxidase N-terminal domain-containing protein [Anaerotignum sp.]
MKKRFLGLLLCLCMVVPMMPVTASAAATKINVSEASYYDDSGDLEGLEIDFGWDTASASSRLTVMTKKLRSAGEAGTNKSYGDFTDFGYYGKSFKNWNAVLDNSSKFGILYYTDEHKISMGKTNTLTVEFDEGDIPLDVNKTYYLYLWTYYAGHYYPDNLFMVLKVKDGKLQYAPATGRNSYGSFTTLWEQEKAPAVTPSKPVTTPSKPVTPSKPTVTSAINVKVENKDVAWTDAVPFIKDGRTLGPLRPIADALGLSVVWNAEAQQAGFSNGKTTVVFELNSKEYVVFYDEDLNEADVVKMDISAISVNGRTYAPAKYLAQAFGYNVGWNGNTSTVTISKGKVETVIPEKKPAAPAGPVVTDAFPPADVTKQPNWYGSCKPVQTLTNAGLVAAYNNIQSYFAQHDRTEPTLIRSYEIEDELSARVSALNDYADYVDSYGENSPHTQRIANSKGYKNAMASDLAPLMTITRFYVVEPLAKDYFGY